jgi:nitronate monooxygenase
VRHGVPQALVRSTTLAFGATCVRAAPFAPDPPALASVAAATYVCATAMWTTTPVTRLLRLDYPIFQGPFGGGNSTPALVAAVSNGGALGAYGAVGHEPERIAEVVAAIRALTARPFAINLWVPIPGQDDAVVAPEAFTRAAERIAPFAREHRLDAPAPVSQRPTFEAQVEALLRAAPPVYSFVMGVPDEAVLAEIRKRGAVSVGTATTVEEAVALEQAGCDVVVASGSDAGGHRGSFLRPVEQSLVGTMSLVPQIAASVRIPVVAAGGIADGRGIAAALALGAAGVQIGTAFLATHESGAPAAHKALLGTERARTTRLTRAFSGRHARGIENELMRALEEHPEDILPYPMQYEATGPLRRAAGKAGRADHLALWAGQSAALARPTSAAELLERLASETDVVLRSASLSARSAGHDHR